MNSRAFTPEEVKQGLHLDLIAYLLEHNRKNDERYYEFIVTTDGYCTIIEWVERKYNPEWPEERFLYANEDQLIAEEVEFPDNHFELMEPRFKEEALKEWLEENPGWEKDEYGRWNKKEEEIFDY